MSSLNDLSSLNVKVKIENDQKSWGGIPPSELREGNGTSIGSVAESGNISNDVVPIPHASTSVIGGAPDMLKIPSIDSASILGKFGWTKVNDVDLPFLLRGEEHYVSVRMIEMKILKTYFQSLPMQLFTIARVNSEYVTANEAALLNEINEKHCEFQFGRTTFSRYDLIVEEEAVKEMCSFLDNCHYLAIGDPIGKSKKNCGIISLSNFRLPFVVSENSQWVPVDMLPSAYKASYAIQMTISKWEFGYLKLCCAIASIDDSVLHENTKVVRVQEISSPGDSEIPKESVTLCLYVNSLRQRYGYSHCNVSCNGIDRSSAEPLYSSSQHYSVPSANVSGGHLTKNSPSPWLTGLLNNNNLATYQKQPALASVTNSNCLPAYGPNSPLIAPSPQQLSPSVEPVTPPFSQYMNQLSHPHLLNFSSVPSTSPSSNIMTFQNSSNRLLPRILTSSSRSQSANAASMQRAVFSAQNSQESHHRNVSSEYATSKITHGNNFINGTVNHGSKNGKRNFPEFISLPSSFVDLDELTPQPKKSLTSQQSSSSVTIPSTSLRSTSQSLRRLPDPVHVDDGIPAYLMSQVRLQSLMLPAVNAKPYSYNEDIMVPLFYVSYKFFPNIAVDVCEQALRQILCVNLYKSNRYISEILRKSCRLSGQEDGSIILIRWTDLQSTFFKLQIIMNEISRRLQSGSSDSGINKHNETLPNSPAIQRCD